MIDTQAIRKKILDLALRGKLTEQLPEDGTAEELYQRIQQKNHSKPIKEKINSEKPFEIPENWKWVHLYEIADTSLGKTLDKSKNTGELCPYLCSINVHWDGIKLDTVKEARFTEDEKTKYRLDPGDLLICEGGDVGRTAIWKQNTVMYYQNALHRVRFHCNINPWFYRDLFEYYKAIGLLDWFSTGMTIKHLVQNSLYSLWLPLPPLSEQKRIVDKVDSMIAILNTIDALQSQYQDNLATLKSKIIDAGIQGKLTEQLPEDGTAEELYQQIQQEKLALEKAGKIKKSKPLAPVTEEEKPFEVPGNWMWTLFGEVSQIHGTGLIRAGNEQYENAEYYYFKMNNIGNFDGICHFQNMVMINATRDEYERYKLEEGDFLFNTRNSKELVGKTAVVPPISERVILNNNILKIRFLGGIEPHFMNYYFLSAYGHAKLSGFVTSTTNVAAIYQRQLVTMAIPLPPLAEQKRIVAKLEELMAVCGG